jgi:dynein heavy chain
VPILQNGTKLTCEPPRGLRANVARSIDLMLDIEGLGDFETCKKPLPWKKLVIGLCFLHGIILERMKFGPLGFNIKYPFNDTDMETCIVMLRLFLDERPTIPWDAIEYLNGMINYGGRVTDDWDRRCLQAIIRIFILPEALEPGYKYSPSGVYYPPEPCSIDELKACVRVRPPRSPCPRLALSLSSSSPRPHPRPSPDPHAPHVQLRWSAADQRLTGDLRHAPERKHCV